jgi:hypothetical protein
MNKVIACLAFVWLVVIVAMPGICGQDSKEKILKEAESQFRAIYDRSEYRVKRFRGDWLGDSSGYTVMEPAAEPAEQTPDKPTQTITIKTILFAPRMKLSFKLQFTFQYYLLLCESFPCQLF